MIKIISFFEEHIEKVILAVVGLVCLWLLVTRVVFSPNVVSYDNRNFSPGTIDNYIGRQADLLKQKLDQPPTLRQEAFGGREPNTPTLSAFTALLDSAVRGVDTGMYLPKPYTSSRQRYAEREYRLPDIGEVNEAVVEHIREVAYVPTEEITEQNGYDKVAHEPNDIDLVTVEANFDAAGLYQRFHECFASEDVPVEWRDPCLARPVFAAVQLQRQELNPDGSWSDWQTVPRIKIDLLRKLFEFIEDTDRLPPGGIKVRLAQFDNREVVMDLLQPPVYQIASPKEEWYPPSLHKKFVELQNQQQIEEKRKAQDEKKNAQLQEQRAGTTAGTTEGRLGARIPSGTYYEDSGGADLYGSSRTQTTRRSPTDRRIAGGLSSGSGRLRDSSQLRDSRSLRQPIGRDSGRLADSGRLTRPGEQDDRQTERERRASAKELSIKQALNELYTKRNSMLITPATNLSKMREPLVFWAHDDTVEPGKTYQYRIRLGVFNPVAGTQQDKSRVKAILWSEFSGPTQAVQIPSVLYLFAKGIQEAAKKVTVQVSKYTMGYWHSEDFLVGPGEGIGKVVESKSLVEVNPISPPVQPGSVPGYGRFRPDEGQLYGTVQDTILSVPETIDYSSGAIVVDVVTVNDWSSGGGKNMFARHYFEMLYSFDGANIEHMPVDMKYWTTELRTMYGEIQNLQKEPKEPLRAWGSEGTGFRRAAQPSLYREEGYDGRMLYEGQRPLY